MPKYESMITCDGSLNLYEPGILNPALIREYRNQFEFRDFADMLACARGKYFAGWAGELLH